MSSIRRLGGSITALVAAAFFSVASCSGNYRINDSGYNAKVECSPEGNEEGFSMELPRCYCNGGIKWSFVVDRRYDGSVDKYIELRRGYLSDDGFETVLRSRDGHTVDTMLIIEDGEETRVTDPELLANSNQVLQDNSDLIMEMYAVEAYCRAQNS